VQIRDRIKELRRVPASELIPNPKNWRTHPIEQQDALRGVLAEVGYADALIARETPEGLMLVDGHLRAETTPDADVPVLVLDIDEAEADLMLATLDPLAAMAGRDEERLSELLSTVTSDNATVNALLQTLANGYEPLTLLEPDPPDEVFDADGAMDDVEADDYVPTVQRGEVWSLGQHRLMCGDATSEGNVVALMDGQTPTLMVTDPPYGVSLGTTNYNPKQRLPDKLQNDDLRGKEFEEFITSSVRHWLTSGIAIYTWAAPLQEGAAQLQGLINAGIHLQGQIIWVKPSLVLGQADYQWRHEVCWYGYMKGDKHIWNGGRTETTVWQESRENTQPHPTQKPVAIFERPIQNSSNLGGVVVDPFVGSGTTIIAAERLGRRCYAMEIEPRYCDVAIKRWEDYTGEKAVKD